MFACLPTTARIRQWKPQAPRHADYWKQQIENALLAPMRAMRLVYLPLLMVYFAYGAMGLTAVAETFWIKKGPDAGRRPSCPPWRSGSACRGR